MSEYVCIKRLRTSDDVIHEIGQTVTLVGDEEASAVRQGAVKAVESSAPATAEQPTTQPNLAQLQREAAQLQDQIATMEHEGGAPS